MSSLPKYMEWSHRAGTMPLVCIPKGLILSVLCVFRILMHVSRWGMMYIMAIALSFRCMSISKSQNFWPFKVIPTVPISFVQNLEHT